MLKHLRQGGRLSTLSLLLKSFRGQPVMCMKESLSEMGPLWVSAVKRPGP